MMDIVMGVCALEKVKRHFTEEEWDSLRPLLQENFLLHKAITAFSLETAHATLVTFLEQAGYTYPDLPLDLVQSAVELTRAAMKQSKV